MTCVTVAETGLSMSKREFAREVQAIASDYAQGRVRSHRETLIGGYRRLAVGKEHAISMSFAALEAPQWRDSAHAVCSTEVLTFRKGQVYLITMVGPRERYEMCFSGFGTILSTWRWT